VSPLPAVPSGLRSFRLPLDVDGIRVDVAGMDRTGVGTPLVFRHGFGSTKEDYRRRPAAGAGAAAGAGP